MVAYHATRRTREIRLRVAERILGIVLLQGMAPAMAGLALGLLTAYLGGRVMETILFDVHPRDPGIFLLTADLLLLVGFFATIIPVYKASKVAPVRALRFE